jgi:hypothetical protein
MTSGLEPFSGEGGGLCLTLRPLIPGDFFTAEGAFSFKFLQTCTVVYHNETRKDTFGSQGAQVRSYRIQYADGKTEEINGASVTGAAAAGVRGGKAARIDVTLA